MKQLLKSILMLVLKKLLLSEIVHNELRELAKKSDTKLDDGAVEFAIPVLKQIGERL